MVRIQGVDLPKNKNIDIALTYIYGIGLVLSGKILKQCKVDLSLKCKDLTEDQVLKIREALRSYNTEGDLRREVNLNIKRLIEVNCYRGTRHKKKLPCRGQRTHTNARTKKGKRVSIAGKKKVTK